MIALVLLAVFAGTMLLVMAAYTLINRRRLAAGDALRERLAPAMAEGPTGTTILKSRRASEIVALDKLLQGKGLTSAIAEQLERAGSRLSVGEFVLLSLLCAVLGLLLGRRIGGVMIPFVTIVAGAIPYANLKRKQAARLKQFEAQLPESIDMLVNAMKSGYSLQAAIKFAGDEMPEPLGPEFMRVYDEQRLGMEMRNALLNLQARIDTVDCKMFVTALLLQRETGGNLAEVLSTLATLMRERVGIRAQIDTLTAEPRLSAIVLSLLPVALFFGMAILNRDFLSPLWLTPMGRLLLLYGGISVIVGFIVLRRLGQIDI